MALPLFGSKSLGLAVTNSQHTSETVAARAATSLERYYRPHGGINVRTARGRLHRDRDDPRSAGAQELEFSENGEVRCINRRVIWMPRANDTRQSSVKGDALIWGLKRMIAIAASLASEVSFAGPWLLAIRVDGLLNAAEVEQVFPMSRYDAASHEESTECSHELLQQAQPVVVERLVGRLARSLYIGSHDAFEL